MPMQSAPSIRQQASECIAARFHPAAAAIPFAASDACSKFMLPLAINMRSCGLMDKALVFGTKDCRFESCQDHYYSGLNSLSHQHFAWGCRKIKRRRGRAEKQDQGALYNGLFSKGCFVLWYVCVPHCFRILFGDHPLKLERRKED